jgi:uncharacterized membrane protein SpoIIM required for sporulation
VNTTLEEYVDLDAFVAEHSAEWRRLDQLIRRPHRRLTVDEVDEMMSLYQRTGAHLSTIRTNSPDPALVALLSRIVLGARGALTGGTAFSWRAIGRFFTVGFPLAVYQARRWWVTTAAGFMALSVGLIYYIASSPAAQAQLLPPDEAKALTNSDFANYYTQYPAQHFALQVWTNNAWLTAECLAAGILIVPVLFLLAQNAMNVGIDGGFLTAAGHSGEFWGLIAPHGFLELTAVFIAAGVGMRIGWAWIAPGPGLTRTRSVAAVARGAMLVALGLVIVLFVSGLLEAFVTPAPIPTAARITIGVTVWAAFVTYVFVFGRRAAAFEETADLDAELLESALPAV